MIPIDLTGLFVWFVATPLALLCLVLAYLYPDWTPWL